MRRRRSGEDEGAEGRAESVGADGRSFRHDPGAEESWPLL